MKDDKDEGGGFELPDITELAAQPHDAYFKQIFSDTEYAVAFFRGNLPRALVDKAEWESICLLPGSFVKSDLKQTHSDLLFSVRLRSSDFAREILLHILFEHQTTVVPFMPLRMLS